MEKTDELQPVAATDSTDNLFKPDKLFWASVTAIILLGIIAFYNSFQGVFVFDDREIYGNVYIKKLWPPWDAMFAPPNVSRPLIGLSLAINYAIGGFTVWSYHALNLLIHLCAALALFGITRRTLAGVRLREAFGKAALPLALSVALIWMVHPLQTQSVTYVIQRCESLMGMFYLLTLYCAIRSFDSPKAQQWQVAAILACAAGALSKQVIVTAPLMVLIYDWLFVANSVKEILAKRWRLYAGLAATWGLLIWTTLASPVNETAGFAVKTISATDYLKSQFGVIVHYLRLSFWPSSLCLDYAQEKAQGAGQIVPYASVVGVFVLATLWALWRRKPVSFLGVWFFLILALTSSFMPFSDLVFEHRMYLSLAAVVALVVLGGYRLGVGLLDKFSASAQQAQQLGRAMALVVVAVIVATLAVLTIQRNFDYHSEIAMWRDVVKKRPQNPRALNNLGMMMAERGNNEEAISYFIEACKYNPYGADPHNNLGLALFSAGRLQEGKEHLVKAIQLNPNQANPHFNLARVYVAEGNVADAIFHFAKAAELDPYYADAYFNLALLQEQQGKLQEALPNYVSALRLRGNWPEALSRLAAGLVSTDDPNFRNPNEAVRFAEKAVSLTQGQDPASLETLALVYAENGRFPDAVKVAEDAAKLAKTTGNNDLAKSLEGKILLYKEGRSRPDSKAKN